MLKISDVFCENMVIYHKTKLNYIFYEGGHIKIRKKLCFSRKSALKIGTLVMAGIMTVSSVFVSTPKVIYADNAAAANVVTEIPGTVSTESSYNSSFLSITGFASVNGNVHDRSEYVGTEYYRVIDDEKDFLDAIKDAQSGKVKVMEITKDLDLGYKYLTELLTKDVLRKYNFVREYKRLMRRISLMQLRMLSQEKLRLWKSQRIWILDISILQSYLQKTFLENTTL